MITKIYLRIDITSKISVVCYLNTMSSAVMTVLVLLL